MKDHCWFRTTYFPMLPDSYVHNMQLNATEPAMIQTSRMILYGTYAWYSTRLDKLYGKFGDYDVLADLIWTHYQMALSHFIRHKVLQHKYDRRYSFWHNCFSSVRTVHYDVWSLYDRWDQKSRMNVSWHASKDGKDVSNGRTLGDTVCRRLLPVNYHPIKKTEEEIHQEDLEILGL